MKTIWITGASSGIGEACAYRYATQGFRLILTSSNKARLDVVADHCRECGADAVVVLPYDFRESDGLRMLVRNAWDAFDGVELLFCNAGVSQRTTVEDTSSNVMRHIMEVNFFAPAVLAKTIVPLMVKAGGGHIAVTTSIAGYFGFPLRSAYSASKHALYGFFESLQSEYFNQNIKVTFVCPGRVKTNVSLNALDKGGVRHGVMDPGQQNGLSVEKASEVIVKAIAKGKREVLVGKKELLMVYVKRFFPTLCSKLSRSIKAV